MRNGLIRLIVVIIMAKSSQSIQHHKLNINIEPKLLNDKILFYDAQRCPRHIPTCGNPVSQCQCIVAWLPIPKFRLILSVFGIRITFLPRKSHWVWDWLLCIQIPYGSRCSQSQYKFMLANEVALQLVLPFILLNDNKYF